METLTFYAVRSKDGKYLRTTGLGGGNHWVDTLEKAKVWTKIGPAKSQVTFWAGNYPEFGVPDIIPLVATAGEPINQDDRVSKALKKKKIEELKRELWRIEERYDKAKREFDRHKSQYAKDRLDEVMVEMNKKKIEIEELKK
jgi:glutamate formiminotransferase